MHLYCLVSLVPCVNPCLGALVKTDEQEVINFLLTTEIIPLCLRIMESGSELSKTVLTLPVHPECRLSGPVVTRSPCKQTWPHHIN